MDFLTVPKAAELAGVSDSAILRWCRKGHLRYCRVGTAYAVDIDSLRHYLIKRQVQKVRIRQEAAKKVKKTSMNNARRRVTREEVLDDLCQIVNDDSLTLAEIRALAQSAIDNVMRL